MSGRLRDQLVGPQIGIRFEWRPRWRSTEHEEETPSTYRLAGKLRAAREVASEACCVPGRRAIIARVRVVASVGGLTRRR